MELETPNEELFRVVEEALKHQFTKFVSLSILLTSILEWSAGVYALYTL